MISTRGVIGMFLGVGFFQFIRPLRDKQAKSRLRQPPLLPDVVSARRMAKHARGQEMLDYSTRAQWHMKYITRNLGGAQYGGIHELFGSEAEKYLAAFPKPEILGI
jgi:hypothetical protein